MERQQKVPAFLIWMILIVGFGALAERVYQDHYWDRILSVMERFPQVDRVEVLVPGQDPLTITDPEQVELYKQWLEPQVVLSGNRRQIQGAIVETVAEVRFFIGGEELVRETLYRLEEGFGEGLETPWGLLVGKVGRDFRSLG